MREFKEALNHCGSSGNACAGTGKCVIGVCHAECQPAQTDFKRKIDSVNVPAVTSQQGYNCSN